MRLAAGILRLRRWFLLTAVFVAVALASASRVSLEPQRLAAWGLDPLSGLAGEVDALRVGRVRIDPLMAGGLRLEDVEVRRRDWVLRARSLVLRPRLGGLLRGALEPVLVGSGFEVTTPQGEPVALLVALADLVENAAAHLPDLRLRRGRVHAAEGGELLHAVDLELVPIERGGRVRLRARQRVGGRLELRGVRGLGRAVRLKASLDEVALLDLHPWLAPAAGLGAARLATASLPARVTGHWDLERDTSGRARHRAHLGADTPTRSWSARLEGTVFVGRDAGSRPRSDADPAPLAGWLHVKADLGRLQLSGPAATEGSTRLLVSGPVGAVFALSGSVAAPRAVGVADLGATHLAVDEWLRKPAGLPTRLLWTREPRRDGAASGLRIEVAGLGAELERGPDGRLTGRTDWVPAATLAALCPLLEERMHGGRVRVVDLEGQAGRTPTLELELEDLALGGARMPFGTARLSGHIELGPHRLRARGLRGELGGVAFGLDLEGSRDPEAAVAWRLRFAARAGVVDLAQPGRSVPIETGVAAGLPGGLRAAAEGPILLLSRQRGRLEGLAVERGTFHAESLRLPDGTLRDLDLDLALHALRLDVRRLAFRYGGRRHVLRGSVDLGRFVPVVQLARGG